MDVEQTLQDNGLKYFTQGADFVTQCFNPQHEDSNPSMRIDRITGLMHCFSCGFKGNVFKHFGQEVSKVDAKTLSLKQKIMTMQKPISYKLPEDRRAFDRDYRGISKDTFNRFEAFTVDDPEELQDRIVFPIRNINGEVKAVIGRYIHSSASPKYLVRPHKVSMPLYPSLPEAINNSVILVEGMFDMLNLHDKGLYNAVCAHGTETISEKSFKRLFGHFKVLGITSIYVMFDGDAAGRKATETVTALLKRAGFHTDSIELGDDDDPGDMTIDDVLLLKGLLYENSGGREKSH